MLSCKPCKEIKKGGGLKMGWKVCSLREFGFKVVSHVKRIKGKCPMCETEFDKEFNLKNGEEENNYKCPCGYFEFDAGSENLCEDKHSVPKEDWQRRLLEKAKKEATTIVID